MKLWPNASISEHSAIRSKFTQTAERPYISHGRSRYRPGPSAPQSSHEAHIA